MKQKKAICIIMLFLFYTIGYLRRDWRKGFYFSPAYTDNHKFTTEHNRQDVKENIYTHAFFFNPFFFFP